MKFDIGSLLQDEDGNEGTVVIRWNDGDLCMLENDAAHPNPVVIGRVDFRGKKLVDVREIEGPQMEDRQKDDLKRIEGQLYDINAANVSMRWIGMRQTPTSEELRDLNQMLGIIIAEIKDLRETGAVDFERIFAEAK